ncbi:hypothetical protein DFH09DRAFT_1094884 [Mycena vulgaris]|nr:hypothetical protein DFH09DRAFT_1094884 [Mycena vulgaris]
MVEAHAKQLAHGLTAQQVKFTTSVPVLRDASVKPIVDLYEWAQSQTDRDLIKRAWEKCTVGEYNLGMECLTSKKNKAAYREYLRKNPDFRKEIEDKIGDVLGLDNETLAAATEIEARNVAAMGEDDDLFTGETNDTDVPLHRVVQDSLQLDITPANLPRSDLFCVQSDTVVAGDNGLLKGGGDTENIWAYNDNGVKRKAGNLADKMFSAI